MQAIGEEVPLSFPHEAANEKNRAARAVPADGGYQMLLSFRVGTQPLTRRVYVCELCSRHATGQSVVE